MGDVIDLFSQQPVPAAEDSGFVTEFIENELGDFLSSVEALNSARDETEFRKYLDDLKYQVNQWLI